LPPVNIPLPYPCNYNTIKFDTRQLLKVVFSEQDIRKAKMMTLSPSFQREKETQGAENRLIDNLVLLGLTFGLLSIKV